MEPKPASPAASGDARTPGNRAFPWVLVVAAAIAGALLAAFRPDSTDDAPVGPQAAQPAPGGEGWTPAPRPDGETVSLTIDFGNGAQRQWAALPYKADMTLGDLMREAREFSPPIVYAQRGEGEMAFLTSLEGVANEGGEGRYWLYRVDDKHGETSFAVCPLEAGSAVLWEFRRGE